MMVKTLADRLRGEAEKKTANAMGHKRKAILKSQIEIAQRNAEQLIEDTAALIKDRDAPNQPLGSVRMILQRGQCPCRCALRLIEGE